jgi:hypothetical protein
MSTQLTPPSIATVKAVVTFSRHFSADLIKLTSTTAAAIDDIPSLFIVFNGTSYAGPDLMLNRVRELSQRIAAEGATVTVVTGGTEDKPKSLQIKNGKSTIDFRLAAERSSDRIPTKFTGTFVHNIDIARDDLATAIAGASSIGSKLLTFVSDGKSLVLTATSESETYTATLDDIVTTDKFQYNYTVEYLHAVDKILPKSMSSVAFSITAKGHMRVVLPTELSQITASVFLLDVKNR